MDLREQQDLLAKLFTDQEFRQTWSRDDSVGGLGAQLVHVDMREVESFADSLFWKRLREVEKLVPLTKQALGESFETEFRSFCEGFIPNAHKRHLDDATGFCRHIRGRAGVPLAARNAANFEATKLDFFAYERMFAFCWRKPRSGSGITHLWPSFAIWLRIGGRVRYFTR